MNSVTQDPDYNRLKDHLIALTGLAFYADRDQSLTDLLAGRLSHLGLHDCYAYLTFLLNGEGGVAEMDLLISQLTIGETYFFRDEAQCAAIRSVILPDVLARKQASRQLRIWSAGCATGAEPYSLAIMLMSELRDRADDWHIAIHATDLNRDYLAQAAEGKFRPWALRSTSEVVKRECFSNDGRVWTIHPRYKQWISFHQSNLAESQFTTPLAAGTCFDLIVCRNVMIYFAPEVCRRLIGHFHHSLEAGGWLVVGACEHNLEHYNAFRPVSVPGARLYQKATIPVARTELGREPPRPPAAPSGKQPAPLGTTDLDGLRQLANRGDWKQAAEYGQRLLAQNRLNPMIHFYQALIFENLGIVDEPERLLRQAIYLDRKFALAHYHLGMALKRHQHLRAATLSFQNVLKVLADKSDEAIATAGSGITVIRLKELARMQLQGSRDL